MALTVDSLEERYMDCEGCANKECPTRWKYPYCVQGKGRKAKDINQATLDQFEIVVRR